MSNEKLSNEATPELNKGAVSGSIKKMKKSLNIITSVTLHISIVVCLLISAYNQNWLGCFGWFTALILSLSKIQYVFKFFIHNQREIYTTKDMISFGYDCLANVYVGEDNELSYSKIPEEILEENEKTK